MGRLILSIVQTMQCVVAEERDDRPVAEREEVEGVAEEGGDEVRAGEERHEKELDDVENGPEGEEGANRNLN